MITAVIFDHDGVIIDNQPAQKQAWKALFKEYNIEISDEEMSKKVRGRPTLVGLKNYFGDSLPESKLIEIAKRKEELYLETFQKDYRMVKGFINLLQELKTIGVKLAIATSTSTELLNITLNKLEISHYFDAIITADQVINSKPDPEIYLLTAQKLGIDPANCAVFEDSFSGVESAQRAGMKVILIMTSHKKEEFSDIQYAINNFEEINADDIIKL